MIIFPAIDLKNGQVVRLVQGDMEQATLYGDDPATQAIQFAQQGAKYLHLVDLDGAFSGQSCNAEAVKEVLSQFPGCVQLGGGIRTAKACEFWFNLGVSRIVIGSAALRSPNFVKEMASEWPERIVVAVDARDGMVATEGWSEISNVSVVELACRFQDAGVASLLFTDIGRDGLLKGVNIEATLQLVSKVDLPVIASGGVKDLNDIEDLVSHAYQGIEGVITGRALYEGRLDLAAAISIANRK